MSQEHQKPEKPLMMDLENFQTITNHFGELHILQDPMQKEYALVQLAKQLDIPLDSFRQMFKDYCLKQEEDKALSSWRTAHLFRLEKTLEKFSRFLDEMDIFRIIGKLASLSIIFGMITFIAEIPQRAEQQATERKRANYEAWQLIRAKLSYI
jgi:hypothetical protein